MTSDKSEPTRITFISNGGDFLADIDQADLDASVSAIVADLLDHATDPEYIERSISVLTLVDEIPAALVLGAALRTVMVGIIGPLQAGIPGIEQMTAGIAETLRVGEGRR